MASPRINKDLRDKAVAKAAKSVFSADYTLLESMKTGLADKLYDRAFGEAEKQAKKLPTCWFNSLDSVYISCAGFAHHRYSCDADEYLSCALKLSKERLAPANKGIAFKINEDDALYVEAQAIVKRHAEIIESKASLQAKLRALLNSVTTFAQLRLAWPEGAAFYPDEPIGHSTSLVPVTLTLELNNILGIKPSKKGTAK